MITSIRIFTVRLLLLTNQDITAPANSAIVVIPNAAPGATFITEMTIPSVTAVVMLKNVMPISETIIILSPRTRKGRAPIMQIKAVLRMPILSDSIPPKAFPIPMNT